MDLCLKNSICLGKFKQQQKCKVLAWKHCNYVFHCKFWNHHCIGSVCTFLHVLVATSAPPLHYQCSQSQLLHSRKILLGAGSSNVEWTQTLQMIRTIAKAKIKEIFAKIFCIHCTIMVVVCNQNIIQMTL